MLESSGRSLGEAFAAEDEAIKVVLRSADAREGSRAFVEKRPPHFTGARGLRAARHQLIQHPARRHAFVYRGTGSRPGQGVVTS